MSPVLSIALVTGPVITARFNGQVTIFWEIVNWIVRVPSLVAFVGCSQAVTVPWITRTPSRTSAVGTTVANKFFFLNSVMIVF